MNRLHGLGGKLFLIVCFVACAFLLAQTGVTKEVIERNKAVVNKSNKTETTKQTIAEQTTKTSTNSTNENLTTTQTNVTTPTNTRSTSQLAGELIPWWVISSGGGPGSSTNYIVNGTIGQLAVGSASSTNYIVKHGYWQDFLSGPLTCCIGTRGNANADLDDKANVADVSYLVAWLFGIPSGPEPLCIIEANANSDLDEKANVSDVSYLVSWLFGIPSGPAPGSCP